MRPGWFKSLSFTLILVLLFNMLPMSAFAQAPGPVTTPTARENTALSNTTAAAKGATVVDEVEENRTKYSKEFRLSNGLHIKSIYAAPVHYQENGQWKEIDNTLKAVASTEASTYTNTAGVWQVQLPAGLTADNGVSITKDGHTLNFKLSGQLRTSPSGEVAAADAAGSPADTAAQQLEADINALFGTNIQVCAPAQLVPGAVQKVDLTQAKSAAQHPETVLDKTYSRLLYANVYGNTDVMFDLDSSQVKESLLLKAYDSQLSGYAYTLDVGSMKPVLTDDGQIHLYDESGENTVMVMPAPFLLDAAGAFSQDVEVGLKQKGSQYILTYTLPKSWLADSSRKWPVILDPAVRAETSYSNIYDVTVYTKSSTNNSAILTVGYGNNDGLGRTYVRFAELPSLTAADIIVDANFTLYKPHSNNTRGNKTIEAHKVTQSWNVSQISNSNQPSFSAAANDFYVCDPAGYYTWDITDIARSWYDTANYGLMLKCTAADEAVTTLSWMEFYSSEWGTTSQMPAMQLSFRNNNGLESYWDYTSATAGRAGTGYINQYSGNLVWVRGDIGFGGNRMPVSISHVYNSNDSAANTYGMGYGWKTNYNQQVAYWNDSYTGTAYYIWTDGDGTRHYFPYSSGGYKDEDGLGLTLTASGSGTKKYAVTDKNGNVSYFDTNGRLTSQVNNQATKSAVTITYTTSTGKLISTITDGAGRKYNFTYASNLLSRISYVGTGSTELAYVSFGYTSSNLTAVTDKDGKSTAYGYTTNQLLSSAQDIDGYKLAYTYTNTAAGRPCRIASVAESHSGVAGSSLSFTYGHNQTKIKDHNGNEQITQFNYWGNTICVQDDQGRAQYAKYAINGTPGETTDSLAKGNQLRLSSKLQNTVGNVFKDSSFESSTLWTAADAAVVPSIASAGYRGSRSLQLTRAAAGTASGLYSSAVSVAAGETYTFSAYVKTGTASAYLALHDGSTQVSSEPLAANRDWTRLQVSYTNTSGAAKSVTARLMTPDAGTCYIDCVQLEKAPTASRYNLVENGDFRYASYGWSSNSGRTSVAAAAKVPASQLDANVYKLTGNYTAQNRIYQTVAVSGSAGDTFVLAGWAKADSVQLRGDSRKFALMLTFTYTDGTTGSFDVPFNPCAKSDIQWQYAAAPIVAQKAYSSAKVSLVYDHNANTAYFDGIQLYQETYGNSYTYDSDGNVISVKDLQGQTTTYEYANNNLTSATLPTGAKLTYTYDGYHNVLSATSQEGQTYTFAYDTYGNNTAVSIVSGSVKLTSTAAYTSDGNRLASSTDAAGQTTTYSYNANTNVLEWVQYPNDTAATRTEYTYDGMYRLAKAEADVNTGGKLSAQYTYANDRLTGIQTPSTAYSFTYGTFGLRSSVSIGSRTLAEYAYTDKNHDMSALDYGNGDSVNYAYDKQGRVTLQTYEDGDTVAYRYDNSGALATVTDSATGRTTTYYYDFTDRLMRTVESGSGFEHSVGYEYDDINNLTKLVETINGVRRETAYTYDEDNRVTGISNGTSSRTGTYDSYSRISQQVTKHGTDTVLTESYTYRSPTAATTSGQVETYTVNGGQGYQVTYTYTYDDNGNILSVSDGTYTTTYQYDSADQLIRENNQAEAKTWTWSYDSAGNILSRKAYAYTTGDLGEATDTVTYAYGDESWGDLLTGYNGSTITYDGIGNPLSDGTWTYTWAHGRQLASMSDGTTAWTFTYDAGGMRTGKTNGTTAYSYIYNGDLLSRMTVDDTTLDFAYDAIGTPLSVTYNGTCYYYATNLQGDVVAILDTNGTAVVTYTYDAWGKHLATSGTLAATLGTHNPLRYRGYVYDRETELYYLQSRYYDPEMGRFLNADAYASTGQGLLSSNMFAYCCNNPINMSDKSGFLPQRIKSVATWLSASIAQSIKKVSYATRNNSVIVKSSHDANRRPNKGAPGSTYTAPNGDTRTYGPDGTPETDYDHDDHGAPDKHPHDPNGGHHHNWKNGIRGPAYSTTLEHIAGTVLVTVCVIGIAVIIANDVTGIGVADDFLLWPLGEGIAEGLKMFFR